MHKLDDIQELIISVSLGVINAWLLVLKSPILFIGTTVTVGLTNYWSINEPYIYAFFVCMILDTIIGTILAWKEKRFTIENFLQVFVKMIVYFSYLIVLHFITQLDILINFDVAIEIATKLLFVGIIINEARSIVNNGDNLYSTRVSSWLKALFDKIENVTYDKVNNGNKSKNDSDSSRGGGSTLDRV